MAETHAPITLLVAEDDPLLRNLLNQIIGQEEDFRVLDTVGNGADVAAAVERHQPRMLLLDVNLPGMNGLEVVDRISRMANPPITLMLSGDEDDETQLEAARSGARGFLCKSEAMGRLPEAIRRVADGEVWFKPHILTAILTDYPDKVRRSREHDRPINRLTDREREVLLRVARGQTNKTIADELFMSVSTVKVHLGSVFKQLGILNRTEAAIFAHREGLLEEDGEAT